MSAPGRQEWCPSTAGVRRGAWARVWSGSGGQATRGHRENSVSDPMRRALSKGSNRVRSELETELAAPGGPVDGDRGKPEWDLIKPACK